MESKSTRGQLFGFCVSRTLFLCFIGSVPYGECWQSHVQEKFEICRFGGAQMISRPLSDDLMDSMATSEGI